MAKIKKDKSDNKRQGNIFESYVETLYQSLGYKTKRNEIVYGQEIDIIAERYFDGVGQIKILIDCKYLSNSRVSNQIVYDFLSYLKTIPSDIGVTKGVIVTNIGFSTQAKQIVNNYLNLVIVTELEKEVLDLNNPYVVIKRSYENEAIFSDYIPLKARIVEHDSNVHDPSKLPIEKIKPNKSDTLRQKEIVNIEVEIITEILNYSWRNWAFITILGDYGTGKTTLVRNLFYSLIVKHLNNESNIKPIYLELKYFYKFQNLELFILNSFEKLFGKEISYDILAKEISRGTLLFIFDGFDEMSPQISQEIRLKNFNTLNPLLLSPCPCIITCRPSYFISASEYNSYLSQLKKTEKTEVNFHHKHRPSHIKNIKEIKDTYEKLYEKHFKSNTSNELVNELKTYNLLELNENQIIYYLSKFESQFLSNCQANSSQIKEFLNTIYDLNDLMTKPLLLTLIKDTIIMLGVKFKEKSALEFGPASLYEIYTSMNLDFDWMKGDTRHFLTKDERRQFAEAISLVMFDKNILDVNYEDLTNTIKNEPLLEQLKERLPNVSNENVISDVQICSFITRTSDDNFRFIHKSFMEFFVARVLRNDMLNTDDSKFNYRFEKVHFPKEILYFLGSFAQVEVKLKSLFHSNISRGKNKVLRRNIISSFIYSSQYHSNLAFSNIILNEINIYKTDFENINLKSVVFEKTFWKNVKIEESILNDIKFIKSEIYELRFHNSEGQISFDSCDVRCSYFNPIVVEILFTQSTIVNTEFVLSNVTLSDNNTVSESTLNTLNIFVNAATIFIKNNITKCFINLKSGIELDNCDIRDSSLMQTHNNAVLNISNSTFTKCILRGVDVAFSGNLETTFKNCSGYVFVDTENPKYFQKDPVHTVGKLTIVNLNKYSIKINDRKKKKEIICNHKLWVRKIVERSYTSKSSRTGST